LWDRHFVHRTALPLAAEVCGRNGGQGNAQ
jgi:hypothetical protein